MNESVQENWSTRALERQINSFYHERLLSSSNKVPVRSEAKNNISKIALEDILKDPYDEGPLCFLATTGAE